jgi:hypothetical protein
MDKKKLNDAFGVTDEQLDAEAKEYEGGTWDAPLGKVVTGRPSIANSDYESSAMNISRSSGTLSQ